MGGTVVCLGDAIHDRYKAHLTTLGQRERAARLGFTIDPRDPVEVANQLLARV